MHRTQGRPSGWGAPPRWQRIGHSIREWYRDAWDRFGAMRRPPSGLRASEGWRFGLVPAVIPIAVRAGRPAPPRNRSL